MRSRYYSSQAIQPSAFAEIRRWIFLASFGAIAKPALADDRSSVARDDLKLTSEPLATENRKYANIPRFSAIKPNTTGVFSKGENNR